MPSFKYLSSATIFEIHQAATEAGLSRSRTALFSGIDYSFVDSIPREASSGAQLIVDLHALNWVESLEDGTVPLETWLANALQSAGLRQEAAVFRRALEQVKRIKAGTEAPAGGSRAGAGGAEARVPSPAWDGKLSGAELEAFEKALIAAYPTPAALTRMVTHKLEKNLAEISSGGSLSIMAFELISAAVAQGWTRALLVGALAGNPGSPELIAFASARGVARSP
ncbi:MAG: effector-associated domain EAD1-containing protein [Byssovorax sp.]